MGANTCTIPIPAPGFTLVYLTLQALQESLPHPNGQVMFLTTVATITLKNMVMRHPSVLATSRGMNQQLGSTSFGSGSSGATGMMTALPGAAVLVCMIVGVTLVGRSLGAE